MLAARGGGGRGVPVFLGNLQKKGFTRSHCLQVLGSISTSDQFDSMGTWPPHKLMEATAHSTQANGAILQWQSSHSEMLYIVLLSLHEFWPAMNACMLMVRPLRCYARPGGHPHAPKNMGTSWKTACIGWVVGCYFELSFILCKCRDPWGTNVLHGGFNMLPALCVCH